MADHTEPGTEKSALEKKLSALNAVYQRFGREGLKDYPIGDVSMLLAQKQLTLRDVPRSRDISDQQKEANRLLELEIRDLSSLLDAHIAGSGLNSLQRFVRQPQQDVKPPFKPREFEKDR